MKRRLKLLSLMLLLLVAGGATVAVIFRGDGEEDQLPTVEVKRGDLVDKALAVGTIEPRVEVEVKSQFTGVVNRRFADVGEFVEAGTPLLEIQPNPTPQELIEAERQIELRELDVENLKATYERQKQLHDKQLLSDQEFERAERAFKEAALQVQMAREQLALLREGRVSTNKGNFEAVVRAPVRGYVLEKMVEVGDPVVPLTTYQEGTVLMTMADMGDLIFRGTVDEIDVGRLREGMPVEIKIGALPGADVEGVLNKIWLKAQKEEESSSTVFPVEVEITKAVQPSTTEPEAEPEPVTLRAGYSANAEVVIEERTGVLFVPERVVDYEDDTAYVTVALAEDQAERRPIETGLSDAIHVEVLDGLAEGTRVQEKPPREIE